MNNSITISVEFYFKGEKLSPSMIIDLDEHIRNKKTIESFAPLLAISNNIDLYSYEYEMLQTEEFVFSNAQGLAKEFLQNGYFDFEGFEQGLHNQNISNAISNIAKTYLDIDDISTQTELRTALIEAFKLGQQS